MYGNTETLITTRNSKSAPSVKLDFSAIWILYWLWPEMENAWLTWYSPVRHLLLRTQWCLVKCSQPFHASQCYASLLCQRYHNWKCKEVRNKYFKIKSIWLAFLHTFDYKTQSYFIYTYMATYFIQSLSISFIFLCKKVVHNKFLNIYRKYWQ